MKVGFVLTVYKQDKRCKSGERVFNTYQYPYMKEEWVEGELNELKHIYKPSEGWRLVFNPMEK